MPYSESPASQMRTNGGLGGDKRAEGAKVNVSIMVNKDGHFMGVMQNGKMISTQDWNKQFEKQNPVNVGGNRNGG